MGCVDGMVEGCVMKMKVAQMAAQRVETMGCVDGMVEGCGEDEGSSDGCSGG